VQSTPLYYTDILNRNAGSKFLSNGLALAVYREVKKDSSPQSRKYLKEIKKLLNCSSELKRDQERNVFVRHYCKSRFCIICNRNKAGDMINKFTTKIERQPDKKMLTLSIKNPKGENLRDGINLMYDTFYNLRKNLKNNYGIKIDFIRKLEITENEKRREFHPHFHFIINEKNIDIEKRGKRFLKLSDLILDEWLNRLSPVTDIQAQKIDEWKEGGAKEIFKYFTKIVTKDRLQSTSKKAIYKFLRPQSFRYLYDAIEGKRIFEKAGEYRKKEIELNEIDYSYCHYMIQRANDRLTWFNYQNADSFKYIHNAKNYFDVETGEGITNYAPRSDLIDSLKKFRYTVYYDTEKLQALQFLPESKNLINFNSDFENRHEENFIEVEIRRLKAIIKKDEENNAPPEIIRQFKDKLAVMQFMKYAPIQEKNISQLNIISKTVISKKPEKFCYSNKNRLCN